jgi:hypothetical protein
MTVQGMKVVKKTDIVSIRIDPNLKNKLQEKCETQKISLNTLINQLLEKQVFWNDLTVEMGWIPIFRSTFRNLLDAHSKERIMKIGRTSGKNELKNSINYLYGRIDLESILDMIKKRFQSMGTQFRHITNMGREKIIIQHDLGKNWHFLIITELNELLNELGYRIINEEYNDNSFSFEIISTDGV